MEFSLADWKKLSIYWIKVFPFSKPILGYTQENGEEELKKKKKHFESWLKKVVDLSNKSFHIFETNFSAREKFGVKFDFTSIGMF